MSENARAGGGGVSYVYRLKSDHTEIQKADGSAAATARTDAALIIGGDDGNKILTKTGISYDDDGVPTLKFEHTDSSQAIETFLEVAAPKKVGSASSTVEELKSETGYKIGGAAGGSDKANYLIISYGASDGTNVMTKLHVVTFKKSSGSQDWESEKWVKPVIEAIGTATKASLSIAAALFADSKVSLSAAQVMEKDLYAKTLFLTPAS